TINPGFWDELQARMNDVMGAYGLGSQNLSSSVDMNFVNTTRFDAQYTSPSGPGGNGWAYITLARSPTRVAQIAVRADVNDRTNGDLIAVRHSEDASNGLWYPSRILWHSGNFDPASKANASHTHSAEDITTGTLADARLPDNVARQNAPNVFTEQQTFQRTSTPVLTVERVGSATNAIIETKTTAGSVYFGNTSGSTFAIGATSGLSSPWVTVSNGNLTAGSVRIAGEGGVLFHDNTNNLGGKIVLS